MTEAEPDPRPWSVPEISPQAHLSDALVARLVSSRQPPAGRDLSASAVRQRYYNELNNAGLLRQPTARCGPPVSAARCGPAVTAPQPRSPTIPSVQQACNNSVAACREALEGLRIMFQAGEFQAFGARHQHLFGMAHGWVGPSVEWHLGKKGVTLVAIAEAFGDLPAGEARIGVWENKPYVGAEAGIMQGGVGNFVYLYRSHDFAFDHQGREHDVSDALFIRVGSPNAGIIVQVDRTLTNFLFCIDFRLFFPLSPGVMFRLGFRPMVRLAVRDRELFAQGWQRFLGGRQRQQAVLNQLADFAGEHDHHGLAPQASASTLADR